MILANSCLAGLGTAKEERNAEVPKSTPPPPPTLRLRNWNGEGLGLFLEPLFHAFISLTLDTYLTHDRKSCCSDLMCGWGDWEHFSQMRLP